MKGSCKNFDVFEFKEEDELSELASSNLVSKFQNPSVIDKYKFLQNVAQGTNYQSKEVANFPCMDIEAIDNDHNCHIASFIPVSMEAEEPTTKQAHVLNDVLLYDSTSHEQHAELIPDKLNHRSFYSEPEPRALSSGAASLGDIQLNCAHGELSSSGDSVDVIPDADESTSDSAPSTCSDIPGDDVPLDGHGLFSDNCFGHWKLDDRNLAVVHPDYIVYSGRYYTETVLIFSSSCIELKCLTADGSQEMLSFQWGIDDIVNIESKCSERLQLATVKVRLISKDEKEGKHAHRTSGIEELHFAVVDLNWYEKQEEIMSLDVRYKALWNFAFDSGMGGEGEAVHGQNGVCIPRKRYFPNFEPFEEVVYPKGDADAVSISKRDVDLLLPDTFVNDTIIDFYIKYLKNKMEPEERDRFHFFNSFFFRKLIDLDKDPSSAFEGRAAFQRVRKWTRKVNLFEKDYIFIPVNFNYHWSLIVIGHPGEVAKFRDEDFKKSPKVPCILHMDSIKGNHTGLKDLVQSYLWEEWKERHNDASEETSSKFLNLRFVPLELPQQQNSYDCGLFLLHYVECFLADAPREFNPFKITKFSNFLNVDWFPSGEPSLKRAKIQKLICEILEKENSPAVASGKPSASNHLTSNSEIATGVEVVSEGCNPLMSCRGNLSSSQAGQGIEITLLSTTSQCGGDSSLVLREFFEAGATGGPFINGQYPTFDRATSFNEFKGTISAIEDDVEATTQFDMGQLSGITPGACVFPYSSRDFGADASWNPGIHQGGPEDTVASPASVCASDDSLEELEVRGSNEVDEDPCQNSFEFEVKENNEVEEDLSQDSLVVEEKENDEIEEVLPREEKTDQPVALLSDNFDCGPDEMIDVVDSQSPGHVLDSNSNADNPIPCPKDSNAQEDGNATCDFLPLGNDASVFEPDSQEEVKRTGNDLLPLAAKRIADNDLVPESDELQPTKKLRPSPPFEGEERLTRSLTEDLQL